MIFLRHPKPDVAPGICYGRLDIQPGPGADAEIMSALGMLPRTRLVISSPATRCQVLAEAIAHRDRAQCKSDARLLELDFGRWEGCAWDEIDRTESDLWAADPWNVAPPGGETFAALHARVREALVDFSGEDDLVVVTHAGPIRAARMILAGADFATVFAEPVAHAWPIRINAMPAEAG